MARLFPALERTVREMQDFNPRAGFDPSSGAVSFRGEMATTALAGAGDYAAFLMRRASAYLSAIFLRIGLR